MPKEISAGVLAYRQGAEGPEFLLVHPGGPFWAGKDAAAWSIPKGLVDADEDGWAAARREFAEELGQPISGEPRSLTPHRTPGGKWIHAWLVEADLDLSDVRSNLFEMEWPRGSGRLRAFSEVDRAAYFPGAVALAKVHRGQQALIEEALALLAPQNVHGKAT